MLNIQYFGILESKYITDLPLTLNKLLKRNEIIEVGEGGGGIIPGIILMGKFIGALNPYFSFQAFTKTGMSKTCFVNSGRFDRKL